jgi:uncharacterized membrane protein
MPAPEILALGLYLVFGCVFGYVCTKLAERKGYSKAGFFALGFFLTVVGFIIAALMPERQNA